MAPDRLQSYVDGLLRASKSPPEIVERLTGFGLDRQAATGMVTNSLDGQWIEEGGGGQPLGRVGPKRMIVGLLLMLSGAAARLASYTQLPSSPSASTWPTCFTAPWSPAPSISSTACSAGSTASFAQDRRELGG